MRNGLKNMNQKTVEVVLQRSGGICEAPDCAGPDFRGLQHAHLLHRKMGGRHGVMERIIDDPRNVTLLCANCHDLLDGRVYSPAEAAKLSQYLKNKTDWEEWKHEHSG